MSVFQGHPPFGPHQSTIGQHHTQSNGGLVAVCWECRITEKYNGQFLGAAWCPFCGEIISMGAQTNTDTLSPGDFVRTKRNNVHWCDEMDKLNAHEICLHVELDRDTKKVENVE